MRVCPTPLVRRAPTDTGGSGWLHSRNCSRRPPRSMRAGSRELLDHRGKRHCSPRVELSVVCASQEPACRVERRIRRHDESAEVEGARRVAARPGGRLCHGRVGRPIRDHQLGPCDTTRPGGMDRVPGRHPRLIGPVGEGPKAACGDSRIRLTGQAGGHRSDLSLPGSAGSKRSRVPRGCPWHGSGLLAARTASRRGRCRRRTPLPRVDGGHRFAAP